MQVIGLLGGVASGKSMVAEQLQRCGAEILNGDRAGHEVLEQANVREALLARWGQEVFDPAGKVDRKAIARIVFSPPPVGPPELAYLEQLTHPYIRQRLEQQAADLRASGAQAVVLDAPVMLKAGWDQLCDHVLFVDAPEEARLERARARGWTETEFRRREASQESLEYKCGRANFQIDNSGTPEDTWRQVRRFWEQTVNKS
jgi:dephospho-CoA kinase